ncbi:MAG: dephospho-CoA kinase, partial [Chloroflexi bacterium]|nr:dephospho-CoA kinase [Chloroflexota bacterium]
MFVIGLTGGIGTGKTHVSRLLEGLGAAIVNADLLGHEVYAPQSEGWRAVVDAFGDGIVADNCEIDRRALGGIVFSDPDALEQLNAIMHPRIYALAGQRLNSLAEQGGKNAVIEAAMLNEAKWPPLEDEVWVTVSTE